MPGLGTWDASKLKIIVGPYTLKGLAEGDFLDIAQHEVSWVLGVGATGEPVRSKTNNRSGSFTVRLMQTSEDNKKMETIRALDSLANAGIIPVSVSDISGLDEHIAPKCWIRKPPDVTYGRDAGMREWAIDTGDISMFIGGN